MRNDFKKVILVVGYDFSLRNKDVVNSGLCCLSKHMSETCWRVCKDDPEQFSTRMKAQRWFCPPPWGHFEVSGVTTGEVLVVLSGQRPGMLLHVLQCTWKDPYIKELSRSKSQQCQVEKHWSRLLLSLLLLICMETINRMRTSVEYMSNDFKIL